MTPDKNNVAYIDGANLHKASLQFGWNLDYARLRIWLTEKYRVRHAYLFIGLIPKYKQLYTHLQEAGFTLVFKEVVYHSKNKVKGNCDAELIVKAMEEAYQQTFNKAILLASDGDYAVLVTSLMKQRKLETVLSPAPPNKCSILLKRTNVNIAYIHTQRSILETRKEKAPDMDGTM